MGMWWGPVVMVVVLVSVGCGDDGIAMTEGASSGATSTGSDPTSDPPTTTEPATTDLPTTTSSTTDLPTTDTSMTSPVTSSTTETDTDTTGTTTHDTSSTTTTGETDTDTDTGGDELVGRSVTQTVNGGTVASSPNFRMVFTIGQPTQNQGTYKSDNFRLQGGLVGANGSPP